MQKLEGRVAVVTGAASGIGRGMAQAFAAEGMKVVLSDIEAGALDRTAEELRSGGAEVRAVRTDVSQPEQVEALARETLDAFGSVHVVCNNAGVAVGGAPTWESTLEDWQWILGVNLMGVVHGIRSFVPILIEQGGEGHVVNTASIAGLVTGAGNALYGVTKHAVVCALRVAPQRARPARHRRSGCSVLCPGWVEHAHRRVRAQSPGRARRYPRSSGRRTAGSDVPQGFSGAAAHGAGSTRRAGEIVVEAIRAQRFYVLTHDWKNMIQHRMENILGGRAPTSVMPPGMEDVLAQALQGEG